MEVEMTKKTPYFELGLVNTKKEEKRIPGLPIVLHGASSVLPKHVEQINKFGDSMDNPAGIPEQQLRRAAASAVCKVNIDSDGRLAMTTTIRKVFLKISVSSIPGNILALPGTSWTG